MTTPKSSRESNEALADVDRAMSTTEFAISQILLPLLMLLGLLLCLAINFFFLGRLLRLCLELIA